MELKSRSTKAVIDLAKIKTNFKRLTAIAGEDNFICPMIKSNAYGHGATPVAETLLGCGAKKLGVGQVEEALELKKNKINCEILIFNFDSLSAAYEITENKFTAVVSSWDQLEYLSKSGKPVNIHLKFNTGMNRLGFETWEAKKLSDEMIKMESKGFFLKGIATHVVDAKNKKLLQDQVDEFRKIKKYFSNVIAHIFSSESMFSYQDWQTEKWGVRPGIAIYGLGELGLNPAMSLVTKIIQIKKIKKGQTVSYGGEWVAQRDSIIGVIPIGYADGLHRSYYRKGEALCKNKRVPFAGRICMDFSMLDLTDIAGVNVSDEICLIGTQGTDEISASEIAKKIDTIDYEIVTSISSRVPRCYI